MDAYTSYILQLSNARTSELRREAAEYRLARAARARQVSRWRRTRDWFRRERRPALEPVMATAVPIAALATTAETADEVDVPLRRSA